MKTKNFNPTGAERYIPTDEELARVKRVHLTAICGMGMGSLAGLFKEKQLSVTGSDASVYPPMSTQLEAMDIPVGSGFDPKRIQEVDLVIVGNVISRGNPELEYALENRIPLLSLPEALNWLFLKNRNSILICGTHGKTTTSALMTYILDRAGFYPGFFVGGILADFKCSYRLGHAFRQSQRAKLPFVIEGDEYDSACFDKRPKFVHFKPDIVILTSVEFDHADIYEDIDDVKNTFRDYFSNLPKETIIIAHGNDQNVREVLRDPQCETICYGIQRSFNDLLQWRAEVTKEDEKGIEFELFHRAASIGIFRTPLLGRHNLENLLAVIAAARPLGLGPEKALACLEGFRGVFRRQQIRGVVGGVTVIDDFAHHPTAVKRTLEALRKGFANRRLWVVFEPRTATSRRQIFQKAYAESFDAADRIVIAQVYQGEAVDKAERFSSEELVEALKRGGKKAEYIATADEIVKVVAKESAPGDVVGVFSNGGFDGIHDKLLAALKEK